MHLELPRRARHGTPASDANRVQSDGPPRPHHCNVCLHISASRDVFPVYTELPRRARHGGPAGDANHILSDGSSHPHHVRTRRPQGDSGGQTQANQNSGTRSHGVYQYILYIADLYVTAFYIHTEYIKYYTI